MCCSRCVVASYFPLKILVFEIPLPLGIANDLPWGGYGYFLESHIMSVWEIESDSWIDKFF